MLFYEVNLLYVCAYWLRTFNVDCSSFVSTHFFFLGKEADNFLEKITVEMERTDVYSLLNSVHRNDMVLILFSIFWVLHPTSSIPQPTCSPPSFSVV